MSAQNQRILTTVYSVLLGLGTIGIIYTQLGTKAYPPLDGPQLLVYSLRYSIPIAMLVTGFLYVAFSEPLFRPPHRWVVILGTALSVFLAVLASTYQYNGRADAAAANMQTLPIIDKRRLYARGTKLHHAVVKSWRTGHKEERILITELEFQSLTLPAEITFSLMPGALKHPWVASYSLKAL